MFANDSVGVHLVPVQARWDDIAPNRREIVVQRGQSSALTGDYNRTVACGVCLLLRCSDSLRYSHVRVGRVEPLFVYRVLYYLSLVPGRSLPTTRLLIPLCLLHELNHMAFHGWLNGWLAGPPLSEALFQRQVRRWLCSRLMDLGKQVCQLPLGCRSIRIIVLLPSLENHLAGYVRGVYVHDHPICRLYCNLYVPSVPFASLYGFVERGERVTSSLGCAIVAI